jgi:hypothetical protein
VGNLKEIDYLKKICLTCRTILKFVFKGIGCEDIDWINPAKISDKWLAVENTAMNILVL